MRITKLLSLDSEPAKPIHRAKPIALAFLERIKLPETFVVGDQTIENALGEVRPLEVGDVLVDENGGFYKIEAPVETIFKVTGDLDLMQEAVYAACVLLRPKTVLPWPASNSTRPCSKAWV